MNICPVLVLAGASLLLGRQTSAPQQPSASMASQLTQREAGLEDAAAAKAIVDSLQSDNQRLREILRSLNPQQWADQKGASTTYIAQLQTAQIELAGVADSLTALQRKTDSLTLALDSYFRLEALEIDVRSLAEGGRRYGDRPAADRMAEIAARDFNSRERFREYVKDLSANLEQNFKMADQEAQRCRGIISKEPPTTTNKRHSKK